MKRLLLTIFALVAIAAGMQATDYGFKMLHIPITSDNYQSESAGKAWSYDPAANVLHLKDGYIISISTSARILDIDGDVNPSLKIQVDGDCHFSGPFTFGILFRGNGNHTICGEGTLTMISDQTDPRIIESYGSTSLTIKDVTINIEAWGSSAFGVESSKLREVILDNCEMNIKASYKAWAAIGSFGVAPVLKNCYLTNGHFSWGNAFDYGNLLDPTEAIYSKEVYIKRAIFVYDVAVTVDEPVAGNEIPTDCTPSSDDYYVTGIMWFRYFDGDSYEYMPEGSTFNKGESHEVLVHLVLKDDGKRYADEKDMKAYVNGKEGEIYAWRPEAVTLRYIFPPLEFEKYDLWVGATQVTELNQEDVFGDGYVSYDPSTKTLTLKGGTYQGTSSIQSALGCGIFSQIDGLTIDVQGETYATGADDNEGIRLSGESNIITGNAKLIACGYNGLFSAKDTLTVSGNVELEAVGHAGLIGRWRTRPELVYYSTLIIKDNAKVRALGDTQASVGRLKEIILADGFSVTAPEGASVGENSVVDANGNDVKGDTVVIERTTRIRGDVNLDGTVDIADVTAVLTAMANGSHDPQYRVNDDDAVDIADVTAILTIMAEQ